jgi:hypothetical protein
LGHVRYSIINVAARADLGHDDFGLSLFENYPKIAVTQPFASRTRQLLDVACTGLSIARDFRNNTFRD